MAGVSQPMQNYGRMQNAGGYAQSDSMDRQATANFMPRQPNDAYNSTSGQAMMR